MPDAAAVPDAAGPGVRRAAAVPDAAGAGERRAAAVPGAAGRGVRQAAAVPEPADLGVREAAAAVAAGELSCAELADACLARVAALESLGAFVAVDADHVRAEAEARDAELRRGVRRPLHGVPVAIKDLADLDGFPTRAGSRATDAAPAREDAPVVARLRAAGTVVLGKTATHEFAYGVTTRATRNPWDVTRLAGGSSGGSAAAVAAGLCPLALGTDTAGSCRIPAALCGVAGMMARPGTLPTDGIVPLAPGLDAPGLLARTAGDLAAAWAAWTGADFDPIPPARAGTPRPSALGDVDAAALAAAERAAALLGAREVPVPPLDAFSRPRGLLIASLALEAHRAAGWWPARADRYGADVAQALGAAEDADPEAVARARARLAELGAQLRAALDEADVLVLPTTPTAAPPRDGREPPEVADRRHAAVLTRLCGPVNVAGLAAVSVFGGLDPSGLPLGVQLVAADEATALGAAVALERLTGRAPRPPLSLPTPAGAR